MTYTLTAGVVGAPQMTSLPVSCIFLCSPLPSRIWQTPGLSIPRCCPPTSFFCLVFSSLSLYLARCFFFFLARPGERETCPYHFNLRLFTMVRRSLCDPIACWILAQTSLLATWSLCEMRSIFREHLISMARIFLCSSSVRVRDSPKHTGRGM